MFKVKIKRLFKLQPNDRLMQPDSEVELTEKEVKAIEEQVGKDFIEVIEEIKADEVDFEDKTVAELKEWLTDNEVDFADENKPGLIKLVEKKAKELAEKE